MPRGRILLGALGAVGVLAVAAAVVVLTGVLQQDADPTGPEVDERFLAAWERHRQGTYAMEGEWRRVNPATGRELRSAMLLVQDPPDRLLRQFGAVRGRLDGSEVRCDTDIEDSYRCAGTERAVGDYDEEVARELENLASYLEGPMPLYEVADAGDGCFDLVQVGPWPDPPYGSEARMCFDEETGALRYIRRQLETLVEETEAHSVRATVTPLDFDLSEDDSYEATGDLPEPDLDPGAPLEHVRPSGGDDDGPDG